MPTGIPIKDPSMIRITDPTMALAIPLSGSPIGFGELIRKPRLRPRTPPQKMYPRMKNSDATAKSAHKPVSAVMALSINFRRARLDMCASPLSAGHAPHQQTRQHVYDERDEKQNQTEFDKRLQINLPRGFGELVGNRRGNSERRVK